jgi:hypothetical protein
VSGTYSGKLINLMLVSGAAVVLALAIPSCSGVPGSPEGAAKKMLRAHGGSSAITRLDSYAGKGFIRDLSEKDVVRSYAFDVYRKGQLYKHKIMSAPSGKLTDVIVLVFDGTTSREWVSGKGMMTIPAMELSLLKYRFPDVIQWAQGADRKGEVLPAKKGDEVVRLRYKDGDTVVTLAVDRKSGLLDGMEVMSPGDTAASYTESYLHYTDVDGIPFPQEFKATYRGTPYYEYVLSLIELKADLPDSLFRVTAEDSAFATAPKTGKPAGAKP